MKRGQVRIIGGQWRGRRLRVTNAAGLRPTPDRVRETLFNWLAMKVKGARCLDAFAGTGALGFEAASRGAASVVMTEMALPVFRVLSEHKTDLAAHTVNLIKAAQPAVLKTLQGVFDIVFLDPPWQQRDLLMLTFSALIEQGKLAPNAWVYLEMPHEATKDSLPLGWHILKETRAGDVRAIVAALE